MIICPLHVNNKCRKSCAFRVSCKHNDYCLLQQALLMTLGYTPDIEGNIELNQIKYPSGKGDEDE